MAQSILREWLEPPHEIDQYPDTPINVSVPFESRVRGAARHFGFFPFFAKKPWPVVQEYVKYYTRQGDTVCDPFLGSGVTAVEALVLGRRAVATDINPVARFISRMTAIAPVDIKSLENAFTFVQLRSQHMIEALDEMPNTAIADLLSTLEYPTHSIPASVRRAGLETIDQLHTPRQLAGLALLRNAINEVEGDVIRDLLLVALANTIRYANITYSLPYDKGRRRSKFRGNANFMRRFSFSPASESQFFEITAWEAFEHVFPRVVRAKKETNALIGDRYSDQSFMLSNVPAYRIHEVAGERTIDYCFTDPPYSNEIYFLDLSMLWAAWLDLPVTDEDRRSELLIDRHRGKTRQSFLTDFEASMESIARTLKDGAWLTLAFKGRDLGLWQSIVSACEQSGLRYVNAVWQDLKIRSTRQIESPNINPRGDMYLNFRRTSDPSFALRRDSVDIVPLPTWANYVEHEVERIIVTYLGAPIDTITAGVVQQILGDQSLRNSQKDPNSVTEDLATILQSPRFETWEPRDNTVLWVMAPGAKLDPSLDATDRARYYLFELLREQHEVTEGEVTSYLLSRFEDERETALSRVDPRDLLRSLAWEIAPHRWRFDANRILDYEQLRLLFQPSTADQLRRKLVGQEVRNSDQSLHVNLENIALLRDRLRQANEHNPEFHRQYRRLVEVLQTVLWRLEANFGDEVELVLAVGDWASEGIDLRNLPYDEVVLDIIVRSEDNAFGLAWRIAEQVFTDLRDRDIYIQFRIHTSSEWEHARELAKGQDRVEELGLLVLSRR